MSSIKRGTLEEEKDDNETHTNKRQKITAHPSEFEAKCYNDVVQHIFTFLTRQELTRCNVVSHRWQHVAERQARLARDVARMVLRESDLKTLPEGLLQKIRLEPGYASLAVQRVVYRDSMDLYGVVFILSEDDKTVHVCRYNKRKCASTRDASAQQDLYTIYSYTIPLRAPLVFVHPHGGFVITSAREFIRTSYTLQPPLHKRVKSVEVLPRKCPHDDILSAVVEWEDRSCSLFSTFVHSSGEEERTVLGYRTETFFDWDPKDFDKHYQTFDTQDGYLRVAREHPLIYSRDIDGWYIQGSLDFSNDGADLSELTATCSSGCISFRNDLVEKLALDHHPVSQTDTDRPCIVNLPDYPRSLPVHSCGHDLWASNITTLRQFYARFKFSKVVYREVPF